MTPEFLNGTAHPRVYFAAGNCLIGNIDNDPESMAVAWLSGMNATSMIGYVVTTWYGRNGWGTKILGCQCRAVDLGSSCLPEPARYVED